MVDLSIAQSKRMKIHIYLQDTLTDLACTDIQQLIDLLDKQETNYCSKFYLLKAVPPERKIGRDAVFAVVEQCDHTFGIQRLANVKFIILEFGYNFLCVGLSPLLEVSDAILGKLLLDGFHVSLEVFEEGGLVKRSGL